MVVMPQQCLRRHNGHEEHQKNIDQLPDWMTPEEARAFLRLGKSTLYDRLRSGKFQRDDLAVSGALPKSHCGQAHQISKARRSHAFSQTVVSYLSGLE